MAGDAARGCCHGMDNHSNDIDTNRVFSSCHFRFCRVAVDRVWVGNEDSSKEKP